MNGYETMSENYKILMQRGEIEKEAAEKAIRVYDFLAGCDTDDLCEMIDSSAFNELCFQRFDPRFFSPRCNQRRTG